MSRTAWFRLQCVPRGSGHPLGDWLHESPRLRPQRFQGGAELLPATAPGGRALDRSADIRQPADTRESGRWWTVFNDPKLNYLVGCAYRQNLTLREAGFRVLQARAQRASPWATCFRRLKTSGSYQRLGVRRRSVRSHNVHQVLTTVELTASISIGNWIFGAGSAARCRRPTTTWMHRGRLRRRAGHHARRHRPKLRAGPHRSRADQTTASQRGTAAGSLGVHREAAAKPASGRPSWTWTRP